nr:hypothetical protein CFP56_11179 [Quercus suber]
MVEQGAADGEAVAEMHRRHGGEGVDVLARHPHGLRVVVAHGIDEAVLLGQESRRRGGEENEGKESEEIRQGHGPSSGGKSGMRGRGVVVPRDEPDGAGDVDQGVDAVEDGEEMPVAVHEPLLHPDLVDGKEEGEGGELLELQHVEAVRLRHVPDACVFVELVGQICGHAVEGIVDDPVEHLDQEGEALQQARMQVVLEARAVGRHDGGQAAAGPDLGRMLLLGEVGLTVIVVVAVVMEQLVGAAGFVLVAIQRRPVRTRSSPPDAVTAPASDPHGTEEDGQHHLRQKNMSDLGEARAGAREDMVGTYQGLGPTWQLPCWRTVPRGLLDGLGEVAIPHRGHHLGAVWVDVVCWSGKGRRSRASGSGRGREWNGDIHPVVKSGEQRCDGVPQEVKE